MFCVGCFAAAQHADAGGSGIDIVRSCVILSSSGDVRVYFHCGANPFVTFLVIQTPTARFVLHESELLSLVFLFYAAEGCTVLGWREQERGIEQAAQGVDALVFERAVP